ncbi:EamA family transporter [Chitinophaga pendula]|uniref:EamA family transporter n=1 Tax=Chitinophaga TaxID=79328 RepID=UPI000BB050F2|nr:MULTISPECIES: EamA family transporter [Chitinophaga]ASZ13758.1 hypothetical protein CK934_23795 [Chitinophaga sp. MD30]UCJ08623.1 EamA family transporter [Chitinophaga pendula]
MKQSKHTQAYIALALVSIFWGTTYLATKIGVRHMHGMMLAGIRQSVAGIILTSFFLLRGYKLPERGMLSRLFIIGVMMLCGSNGLLTWAMHYIPSGLGAIIAATVPIWMTIFSYFLLSRNRFSLLLIVGMMIGLLGVGGIFYDYLGSLLNPDFRFGILLAFIGCLCWAFGSVLTAKWALDINFLYGAGFQMVFSGIVMISIATAMGYQPHVADFTIELWGSLIYLIFIGSILSYSSYVFALNTLPPSLASVYAYINPIVAVLLGWLILKERLNWVTGISCLVTLLGVYLVNYAFNKHKKAI